jgi:DNA-directed RNA polymerase specialized sigma24 family protein
VDQLAAAVALDEIPFERLFQAWRDGGDLSAWNDRFGPIVAQVAARIRARFGDPDLADSAAQSAMATFVRRMREGEPDSKLDRVDGPDALFGYLVLRAHHKAWEKLKGRWRQRPLPADWDRAAQGGQGAEDPDLQEPTRREVRREMEEQLRRMLERMNLLLGTELQRKTFYLMYRSMYGVERLTDVAIAQRVGVAAKTVQRVRRKVEEHWPGLVAEGRRAVKALEERLRSQAGD